MDKVQEIEELMQGTDSPRRSPSLGQDASTTAASAAAGGHHPSCMGVGEASLGDGPCESSWSGDARSHVGFGLHVLIGRLITEVGVTRPERPTPEGFVDVPVHFRAVVGNPFSVSDTPLAFAHEAYEQLLYLLLEIDPPGGALESCATAPPLDGEARTFLGRALLRQLAQRYHLAADIHYFDWAALHDWLQEHALLLRSGRSLRLMCRCFDERSMGRAPLRSCHAQTLRYILVRLASSLPLCDAKSTELATHEAGPSTVRSLSPVSDWNVLPSCHLS
jgi:hypothetical protein